jgi:hypothetical protein
VLILGPKHFCGHIPESWTLEQGQWGCDVVNMADSRNDTGLEEAVLAGGGEYVWGKCYRGVGNCINLKHSRYHSPSVITVLSVYFPR